MGKEDLEIVEWSAFFIGALGTVLWAVNNQYSKWSSIFWLLSGLLWIRYAVLSGEDALLWRDCIGLAIYAYGIYGWLIQRRSDAAKFEQDLIAGKISLTEERINRLFQALQTQRKRNGLKEEL